MAKAALALLGAAFGVSAVWLRPMRVEVNGMSMAPVLLPGDRLLAVRARRYRVGDLVVVPDPRAPSRPLVKRVAALPRSSVGVRGLMVEAGDGEVVVLGDNPSASTDSRTLGPLRLSDISGRCVYRYHPSDRAGVLRGGSAALG